MAQVEKRMFFAQFRPRSAVKKNIADAFLQIFDAATFNPSIERYFYRFESIFYSSDRSDHFQ